MYRHIYNANSLSQSAECLTLLRQSFMNETGCRVEKRCDVKVSAVCGLHAVILYVCIRVEISSGVDVSGSVCSVDDVSES